MFILCAIDGHISLFALKIVRFYAWTLYFLLGKMFMKGIATIPNNTERKND